MMGRINPPRVESELQVNKAKLNASDTEGHFSIYIYLFRTDWFIQNL